MRVRTAAQIAEEIPDSARVLVSGNGDMLLPDAVLAAVEERFLRTGSPRNLTIMYTVFPGCRRPGTGIDRLRHPGLLERVYAGSYSSHPSVGLSELVRDDEIEAYLVPYGVIHGMLAARAAGRPGHLTRVGVGTFADPRVGGSRITPRTTEDLGRIVPIGGEDLLFFPAIDFDLALLRATTVDEEGNATLEREPNSMAALPQAMAASASGGKVVVQVEQLAAARTLHPRHVAVPGLFVDEVVVAPDQMDHLPYDPAWTGDRKVPAAPPPAHAPLDAGALVARRAALELRPDSVVVLGMGLAAGVPAVAWEEGIADQLTFNVEHGPIGGVPSDRRRFGTAVNMTSFLDPSAIFDMYAAGRHDIAMLGMGEVDREGNVNVAFVNGRYNIGGFLDIVHAAPTIVFCGTFTAGGLAVRGAQGQLHIEREGRTSKFVDRVAHQSFDAAAAQHKGQLVRYVTERAVFELVDGEITLVEVAPGVDIERDVLGRMGFAPAVAARVKTMDAAVLRAGQMGLAASDGFSTSDGAGGPEEDRIAAARDDDRRPAGTTQG